MNAIIKNPKFMWLVGAVLVGFYFYPTLSPVVFQTRQHQFDSKPSAGQQASTHTEAASVPRPPSAPASPSAIPPAAPGSAEALGALAGNWHGMATLQDQGICGLKLELRVDTEKQGQFLGNTTYSCLPLGSKPGQPKLTPMLTMLNAGQTSAILRGSVVSGSIEFHVDKVIGERCVPSAFTFTPFGASQLGAEWKDPICGNGQMILQKG
jgi:hypothetical protein